MTWILKSILNWFMVTTILVLIISIIQAFKKTNKEPTEINKEDKLNDVVNELKEIIRELENGSDRKNI